MSKLKNLVFTYGTLKTGFPNHNKISAHQSRFMGKAKTMHKYPLIIHGAYHVPFLLDAVDYPGSSHIHGEVYRVSDKGLDTLDKFEGIDQGYYTRKQISVFINEETPSIMVHCYFKAGPLEASLLAPTRFLSSFGEKELSLYIPPDRR